MAARIGLCVVVLAGAGIEAWPMAADELSIAGVHRSGTDPRRLFVVLDQPLPSPEQVGDPDVWHVRAFRPDETPAVIRVARADVAQAYATNHRVTLGLEDPIPPDALRVEVMLLLANQPSGSTTAREDPLPAFERVDDPDDATVYFNGIVAPAKGAKTLYTIDSRADLTLRRFGQSAGTRLGISGELKTDERTHVDPDSARLGVSLRRVTGFAPVLTWDIAALEFNREAKLVNLISAASLVQTWGTPFTRLHDGTKVVRATINFQAGLGLEVGANLRNVVRTDSGEADGATAIVRAAPTLGIWLVMPTTTLDRITLSAEYALRVPATRELFLETRGLTEDADPVPLLTRKARHYVTASARFMITKWVGFEAKYEFGSLPPVFQVVDHGASVGLTFMAKQNE
jgi:hypothetical protein